MKRCPECGWPCPFLGCPTCPPKVMNCPRCGAEVLIEPMPDEAMQEILKDHEEREAKQVFVNLGDFKSGGKKK